MKPIEFVGNSLDNLREFPVGARRESGYQLDRVQHGIDPGDWKPMATVGSGAREIRIREQGGAFRIIYVLPKANTEDGQSGPRHCSETVQTGCFRKPGKGGEQT